MYIYIYIYYIYICIYIYILYIYMYIYHLGSVRFEYSVCHGSLQTPYILCSLFSLLSTHWFIGPATCKHTSGAQVQCMSCYKAIAMITGSAHCFHDCVYIMSILLLWDLSSLCAMYHFWPLIYYASCLAWFIGASSV